MGGYDIGTLLPGREQNIDEVILGFRCCWSLRLSVYGDGDWGWGEILESPEKVKRLIGCPSQTQVSRVGEKR